MDDDGAGLPTATAFLIAACAAVALVPVFVFTDAGTAAAVGLGWASMWCLVAALLADRKSSHTRRRRWIWRSFAVSWLVVGASLVLVILERWGTAEFAELGRFAGWLRTAALVPALVAIGALVIERVQRRMHFAVDAIVVTLAYGTLAAALLLPALDRPVGIWQTAEIITRTVGDLGLIIGSALLVLVGGRLIGYRLVLVASALSFVAADFLDLVAEPALLVDTAVLTFGAACLAAASRMPLEAPTPLEGYGRIVSVYVTILVVLFPVVLLAAFAPSTPGWILALGFLWVAVAAGRLAAGIARELFKTQLQRDSLVGEVARGNEQLGRRVLDLVDENTRLSREQELRERYLSMVNHELRTPLTVVSGFAKTLVTRYEDLDDEHRREIAESILRASHRLRGLVLDLQDSVAFERGTFDLQPTATTLDDLAREADENFAMISSGHRLATTTSGPTDRSILVDAGRVAQVLRNVLENAVKFAPSDSTVELDLGLAGEVVSVRVADAGPGIDADHIDRLFEPFVTFDAERGTGLGLYICKRIVEAHGGAIEAANRDDSGAVFSWTIRAEAAPPLVDPAVEAASTTPHS